MWSEEELRDIEPERPMRPRSYSPGIRADLVRLNLTRAAAYPHDQTRSSIIYAPTPSLHGNFIAASYRRICANPDWHKRLTKPHTAKRQGRLSDVRETAWCELDTATSSDALLMNIFCYPRSLAALATLLNLKPDAAPVFGFKPRIPRLRNLIDITEIDMKLGDLLVEAKLTESNFQSAPLRKLERYQYFDEVFDRDLLLETQGSVRSYQLIRGVLAAYAHRARFAVFCDARRPDLIEAWFHVIRAVRSYELQSRLRLYTWQELACPLPATLRSFLAEKYGIES